MSLRVAFTVSEDGYVWCEKSSTQTHTYARFPANIEHDFATIVMLVISSMASGASTYNYNVSSAFQMLYTRNTIKPLKVYNLWLRRSQVELKAMVSFHSRESRKREC